MFFETHPILAILSCIVAAWLVLCVVVLLCFMRLMRNMGHCNHDDISIAEISAEHGIKRCKKCKRKIRIEHDPVFPKSRTIPPISAIHGKEKQG